MYNVPCNEISKKVVRYIESAISAIAACHLLDLSHLLELRFGSIIERCTSKYPNSLITTQSDRCSPSTNWDYSKSTERYGEGGHIGRNASHDWWDTSHLFDDVYLLKILLNDENEVLLVRILSVHEIGPFG